ncbi:hypothetical protein C0989_005299 [Termitomyces sp. Mn162]|nr:hypothetical protein C0989_005299 [Termitomyces sp. Mn162]KAH0587925.1 hypothetical protein H2248_006677 [Termitomyces sp. 'cryptogamus']
MLASSVNETPRPRPPAKIRRSSALAQAASTPPPSYAAAFTLTPDGKPRMNNSLLGSPMAATFQRVGWDGESQLSPTTEEDLEWMNEKSREELSGLLVKADGLIKERENELGIASAVCKSLYDNNVMLKTKHQQLLARLPSSSPSPSPSPEPISRTSSRYSISLNRPISEYDSSPVASSAYKHARKISVSTDEISHLADQNAELLEKLERMESESLSADQAGRRVLKRLEKEILVLREELEKTQAKSEELEEKAKAGWQSQKRKEEREAKFRAMRNLGRANDEDDEMHEIRDFAPEGSIFGGPGASRCFFPSGETPRRLSGTPLHRPPLVPAPLTPHPESAIESTLIAQLLEKIQELEETNVHIIDQQNETRDQLNAVQRETEQITKVYECLADANIIELAGDSASDRGDERASYDETVRFKSFARNLAAEYMSTPNADNVRQHMNLATVSRTRKSVVGLFDNHDTEKHNQRRDASTPDQLKSFNLPVPFASPEGHPKSLSTGTTGLASPALSSISPSHNNSQISYDPRRTLETELGNEFNDGWGLSAPDRSRTNSLYDLSPISVSPSPSSANRSFERSRSITSPREKRGTLPTPMSMSPGPSALRLSVEPPTPDKVAAAAKAQPEVSPHSLRYQRMSKTVRSRANRWVDGRFKDTLTGNMKVEFPTVDYEDRKEREERGREQDHSQPSTPLPERLAKAFDVAVENFTGQPESRSDDSQNQEAARASGCKVDKKPRGFGAILLEIWLWLQFVIIILVFLWTMARKGPKSVLGDAGAGGRRRSRTMSSVR